MPLPCDKPKCGSTEPSRNSLNSFPQFTMSCTICVPCLLLQSPVSSLSHSFIIHLFIQYLSIECQLCASHLLIPLIHWQLLKCFMLSPHPMLPTLPRTPSFFTYFIFVLQEPTHSIEKQAKVMNWQLMEKEIVIGNKYMKS